MKCEKFDCLVDAEVKRVNSKLHSRCGERAVEDEEDPVILFVYSLSSEEHTRPTAENVYEWVQQRGILCHGENDKYQEADPGLKFPEGSLFTFFQALKEVIGMDLLDLVGTNLTDSSSMSERDLICGSLPREVVSIAVVKMRYWMESYEQEEKAWQKILHLGMKREWFFPSVEKLASMLQESISRQDYFTMGIVE